MIGRPTALTALLVAPDRNLADQFTDTLARTRAFQVVGDLKTYPSAQTLEIRLRQLRPDVLLLDLATSLDTACELIRGVAALDHRVHIIGLHKENDSAAILRSLRMGATEFLYAPFEISIQEAAIARIQRILQPEQGGDRELGKVVAFTSTKPGSGASTLATQTACALSRRTRARVLLLDLDLFGGAAAFYLNLDPVYSVVDVLQHADRLDTTIWSSAVVSAGALDVLAAPETPYCDAVESSRLHDVIQFSRMLYDWVVVDLPNVFHRLTLMTALETERTFLVATPELATLHLARKSVKMLNQLGFDLRKFMVLVNRVEKRNDINSSDLGKLLECPVDASLPNDFFSLQQVLTGGGPLGADTELGRAIDGLANKLSGADAPEKKGGRGIVASRPALSQL